MNEPVTLPAPEVPSTPLPPTKWERERGAFLRLLPELLRTHRGKFVAVHDEQVVDSGDDPIALIKRVHARFGYVPIHVEEVAAQPATAVRIPHYREYRPKEPA
jgi:Family of unknown function (DUF5678)